MAGEWNKGTICRCCVNSQSPLSRFRCLSRLSLATVATQFEAENELVDGVEEFLWQGQHEGVEGGVELSAGEETRL